MSRQRALTDEALATALDRRATRVRPGGLRDAIMAEVSTTPQRRRPWLTWSAGPRVLPERRLLWLIAVVAMLAALAAGAILAGSRLLVRTPVFPLDPPGLVSSGIEVLASDEPVYSTVVADRSGSLWAAGPGEITRYTPTSGAARTWTVGDDVRFAATGITPARAGGVWLIGEGTIRRFDGTAFREVANVPARVGSVVEAPDGSLWVMTEDGMLLRLAGSAASRIDVPGTASNAGVDAIALDTAGHVWVGGHDWAPDYGWRAWGASYDGSGWRLFVWRTNTPAEGVRSMTAAPDGSLLIITQRGLARFDGTSWTDLAATWPNPPGPSSVAATVDGSIWAADSSVTVGHLTGGAWTLYGASDGLPGPVYARSGRTSTVVTADGVFVAVQEGVYRLAGSHWERALPAADTVGPGAWRALAPIARDEAWAVAGQGAWHFAKGTWTPVPMPGEPPTDLLRSVDGSLWATADGVFVQRGSGWVRVSAATGPLATDGHGVVWVAGSPVRSFALEGGSWTEQPPTAPTSLITAPETIAIQGDGTIWMGQEYAGGHERPGLVRYRDGAWESVHPPGVAATLAIRDLTRAQDGSMWMAGADLDAGQAETTNWVGRFDGTAWTVFRSAESLPIPADARVAALAAAPDGSILVATSDGLVRFDGTGWTVVLAGLQFSDIAVAADGTIWAGGTFGIARLASSVTGR